MTKECWSLFPLIQQPGTTTSRESHILDKFFQQGISEHLCSKRLLQKLLLYVIRFTGILDPCYKKLKFLRRYKLIKKRFLQKFLLYTPIFGNFLKMVLISVWANVQMCFWSLLIIKLFTEIRSIWYFLLSLLTSPSISEMSVCRD